MKLTFNAAAPQGEEWQRKNRKPHIYPPPNDGREWILVDEAAALFGIKTHSMMQKSRTHRLHTNLPTRNQNVAPQKRDHRLSRLP